MVREVGEVHVPVLRAQQAGVGEHTQGACQGRQAAIRGERWGSVTGKVLLRLQHSSNALARQLAYRHTQEPLPEGLLHR